MDKSNRSFNVDPKLFQGFLDDSLKSLASLEPVLSHLEGNPGNYDHINTIYQTVLTIKGNATFFDLIETRNFTRRLSILLDKIVKKEIPTNHSRVSLLLRSVAELKIMLMRVSDGESEIGDSYKLQNLARQIDHAIEDAGLHEHGQHLCKQVSRVTELIRETLVDKINEPLKKELDKLEKLNQSVFKMFFEGQEKSDPQKVDTSPACGEKYHDNKTNVARKIQTARDLLAKPADQMSDRSIWELQSCLEDLQSKLDHQADHMAHTMIKDYHSMVNHATDFNNLLRDLLRNKLNQTKKHLQQTSTAPVESETQTSYKERPSAKPLNKPNDRSTPGSDDNR